MQTGKGSHAGPGGCGRDGLNEPSGGRTRASLAPGERERNLSARPTAG